MLGAEGDGIVQETFYLLDGFPERMQREARGLGKLGTGWGARGGGSKLISTPSKHSLN